MLVYRTCWTTLYGVHYEDDFETFEEAVNESKMILDQHLLENDEIEIKMIYKA